MHTNDSDPGIPSRLLNRPTVGGLVVPYTTLQLPNGRWRFGAVDVDRRATAFTHRLCQTCGTGLQDRIVFAMRDMDLTAMSADEPGMHPECTAYSATACPIRKDREFRNSEGSFSRNSTAIPICGRF